MYNIHVHEHATVNVCVCLPVCISTYVHVCICMFVQRKHACHSTAVCNCCGASLEVPVCEGSF